MIDEPHATDDTFTLPVPFEIVCEWGGGKPGPGGVYTFAPPPIELKRYRLALGDVPLGDFVIDDIEVRAVYGIGATRTTYFATVRRLDTVPGPDVAMLLRPAPGEYAGLPVLDPEVLQPADRCSAATGLGDPERACRVHPDGAHRCYRGPRHMLDDRDRVRAGDDLDDGLTYADHLCDCGFAWSSVPTVKQQAEQFNRAARDH